jgi:hypothetical protein
MAIHGTTGIAMARCQTIAVPVMALHAIGRASKGASSEKEVR